MSKRTQINWDESFFIPSSLMEVLELGGIPMHQFTSGEVTAIQAMTLLEGIV